MVGRLRRCMFWLVSACFAFMFGVLSLAAVDLVVGLLPAGGDVASSAAMGNMAFGVIGLVLIAPAFASQLGHRANVAAMHQLAVVVLALAIASVWSGEALGVLGAAAVLLALTIVWALHPDRGTLLSRPPYTSRSRPMLGLALVVSVPAWTYAAVLASRGRAGLPPENSFAFVPSQWSALVAMAAAVSLLAVLAASRGSGWAVPAGCVAASAFIFGLACAVNPDAPGSGGRLWAVAAFLWSGAWVLAARASLSRRLARSARP